MFQRWQRSDVTLMHDSIGHCRTPGKDTTYEVLWTIEETQEGSETLAVSGAFNITPCVDYELSNLSKELHFFNFVSILFSLWCFPHCCSNIRE